MSESVDIDPGVQPGEVLAGKYRVERVLGVGAMGVIVAAHHLQLDEKVALKFLRHKGAEALARFEREARAAVKIKSEHVARVIDVGRLETGAPYMVMEYLEGSDLDVVLREHGPLPVEQAAEFVLQACEAIAEAHGLGIVHRDLKPANLFCVTRADGLLSVKVLDFGISKITQMMGGPGGEVTNITRTSVIVGSPIYMSPEQLRSSKQTDARSDIWALGVILFELVTGQSPFDAENALLLAVAIGSQPPQSLRAIRPEVPEAFERVVLRCLEKDRDLRFQNVGELAMALREFVPQRAWGSVDRVLRTTEARRGSGFPPPRESGPLPPFDEGGPTVIANPPTVGATAAAWGQSQPPPPATPAKRRMAPVVIAAVAVLAVLLLVAGLVTHHRPPVAPTTGSATPPPSVSSSVVARAPDPPAPSASASDTPSIPVLPVTSLPLAAPSSRPGRPKPRKPH